MTREHNPADLGEATLLHVTSEAIKVRLAGEEKARWFPHSTLHDDSELYCDTEPGTRGKLVVH